MSGGFFRGTSAEQDTRFSNKKAKLLKSQKFAPELEYLVDMTKVKMDVMRPWIAKRVTELIGFEDEVLINFIYSLLDGKEVNGKEVQISLTGFMERNTGKFMKELWSLLISAQNNASGVPQQFLDAKEEETRKKMAETDRIASEIQRKKEKEARELQEEKNKKMDGDLDASRNKNASLHSAAKDKPRASSSRSSDEEVPSERNGLRGRSRVSKSPHAAGHSSSPRVVRTRSISKSLSGSRSYSEERRKSRSISGSHKPRGRSSSSERIYRSSGRRSITPRRRRSPQPSFSPPRRRFSRPRQRSTSHSRQRSPSPIRYRRHSPFRRRSRSPFWHRSRSPVRRRSRSPNWRLQMRNRSRSPVRRRSPSPIRRRSPSPDHRRPPSPVRRRSPSPLRRRSPSPVRRRSPSPVRRRSPSPVRRRSPSPVRRRSPSPLRRRSPSPVRRRSPSPLRRRSPSPVRRAYRRSSSTPPRRSSTPVRRRSPLPVRRRSITPVRHRSPSPEEWSSPSPVHRRSLSPIRRKSPKSHERSPVQSPRERTRPPISQRSPMRNSLGGNNYHREVRNSPAFPQKSPSPSESPPARARSVSEESSRSPYESPLNEKRGKTIRHDRPSPVQRPNVHKSHHGISELRGDAEEIRSKRESGAQKSRTSRKISTPDQKDSRDKGRQDGEFSSERLASHQSDEILGRSDGIESRKKDQMVKSENKSGRVDHQRIPEKEKSPATQKGAIARKKESESYTGAGYKADEKSRTRPNDSKGSDLPIVSETLPRLSKKVDQSGSEVSGFEESDKHVTKVKEKRRHKRSERQELTSDDSSYDSEVEDRKELKRRRKEEKRLKKEERRRRREERRRRRNEKRAEKIKLKSASAVSRPSDVDRNHEAHASDDELVGKRESRAIEIDETESQKKKMELELREKALESLRAKKGTGY